MAGRAGGRGVLDDDVGFEAARAGTGLDRELAPQRSWPGAGNLICGLTQGAAACGHCWVRRRGISVGRALRHCVTASLRHCTSGERGVGSMGGSTGAGWRTRRADSCELVWLGCGANMGRSARPVGFCCGCGLPCRSMRAAGWDEVGCGAGAGAGAPPASTRLRPHHGWDDRSDSCGGPRDGGAPSPAASAPSHRRSNRAAARRPQAQASWCAPRRVTYLLCSALPCLDSASLIIASGPRAATAPSKQKAGSPPAATRNDVATMHRVARRPPPACPCYARLQARRSSTSAQHRNMHGNTLPCKTATPDTAPALAPSTGPYGVQPLAFSSA
ncbi:hypothetical protein BDV95DRAFT_591706 [Massariosphaeria phaeospora]|uniref:Uncharacterized protein n=1 Tax=Massariosphaeria phaeospora TaxID=100035 RepID=A0A7C8MU14_9PLEO|nr:hypothetical protein BDV95DRAFT_591706 [Massariosphaeria phaeospora]